MKRFLIGLLAITILLIILLVILKYAPIIALALVFAVMTFMLIVLIHGVGDMILDEWRDRQNARH